MVAYGLPVIHQSLASAPLDIKEAIDWLIRIGGKDVTNGENKPSTLTAALENTFQKECYVTGAINSVNEASTPLKSVTAQLATFIGYETRGVTSKSFQEVNGSGIGRRGGHSILSDIAKGGFLLCCKDESACTSLCKCCQNGNVDGGAKCNPNNCPIKKVLECSITLIGMCGEKGDRHPNSSKDNAYVCCILSFLITCFSEDAQLDKASIKCNHCDNGVKYNMIHIDCHKDCQCTHKRLISKVACRINCLIQLASTINTLYINKKVPMCLTCHHCKVCNPEGTPTKCKPCSDCARALKGTGEHCDLCRTGQCCKENNARNETCKRKCNSCRNCSIVRNAKAFWHMLDHALYSCGKCTTCTWEKSPPERNECQTCKLCPGDSCVGGCKNRKQFARLIYEFLHFMVYNFGEVAYTLKGNITSLKDGCCKQRSKSTDCPCTKKCCGPSTGASVCDDCKAYCICCVDGNDKASCNCANQCSEKLELILRPALSGYVSAYDYNSATWENLCKRANGDNKGKCSDQCNTECRCDTSDCPSEGCCTHCPKRQCAKILCMVLPAIYSFLNYVKKHITDELRDGSGNVTSQWASALIDGDTQLGDLFRTCGFQSNRLKLRMGCDLTKHKVDSSVEFCRLRDHKPGNLKDILESLEKCNAIIVNVFHLSHVLSDMTLPYRKPETVRDKLLWLCGLPYSDVYEELQQRFKDSVPNGSSSQHLMELTLSLGVFPFHILEDGSQSVWHYVTQGFQVPNTKHRLYYNRDPVRLLWEVYDAVYDVTCPLMFMSKQCSVSSINSGWEDCTFGKDVHLYGINNDICQCQRGRCNPLCNHCKDVCKTCRGEAKCVCCCPHCEQRPDRCSCLMRYIISSTTQGDQSTASPFYNVRYGHMAFPRNTLRKAEMRGAALYDCISGLLTDDHAVFSRLLECLLIAGAGVPDSVPDYYALFLGLGMRLQMESQENGRTHKALAVLFKSKMRDTFFGVHERIMECVVSAVRKFYKEDSGHTSNGSGFTNGSAHNVSDLMSIYGCYSGVGCVGYMYALSSGPYELFPRYPHTMVVESASLFTKWIMSGATSLYNSMIRFAEEVSTLECCKQRNNCTCNPTVTNACECTDCNCFCVGTAGNCSCGTIIKCKAMHPLLYRNGLTFQEPDMWSSPKRRCRAFVDTLNRFIGRDSMLYQLIEAIENFLWHIRMPFCIAFLTLWSTAFCFLMYVFIGYLDRLGIRSRWLSQKSFAHPLQFVMNTKVKPMGSSVGVI